MISSRKRMQLILIRNLLTLLSARSASTSFRRKMCNVPIANKFLMIHVLKNGWSRIVAVHHASKIALIPPSWIEICATSSILSTLNASHATSLSPTAIEEVIVVSARAYRSRAALSNVVSSPQGTTKTSSSTSRTTVNLNDLIARRVIFRFIEPIATLSPFNRPLGIIVCVTSAARLS